MKREDFDNNPILSLSFDFSLMIINYCEILEANRKYILAKQLLKSGISIGANAMEAQNAESAADFIHKMKIAAKEAEETQYWLWLCNHTENYPQCNLLIQKVEEILKVLNKILSTAKNKQKKI